MGFGGTMIIPKPDQKINTNFFMDKDSHNSFIRA